MSKGLLDGIRVLDSSAVWAMPLATAWLGDMGAEVIKIESCVRLDTRSTPPHVNNQPGEEFWNRSGVFNTLNRSKRSVTINIQKPEGVDLYKELVRVSDVLVENNRPGVMERFGLDYQSLRRVKPDLIMVSNSAYGYTGPWRTYGGIALSLEPTSGTSFLTGYQGGPPVKWNYVTDFPVTYTGLFAILGALYHRNRTGQGQWIDLSMYQVGASTIGEYIMDYMLNGREAPRMGNRHPFMAPHGCYPCRGADRWLALSVSSDEEWHALCRLMGRLDLSRDERFADSLNRLRYQDEIDQAIREWSSLRDAHQAARILQEVGVAAAPVQTARDVLTDPHLRARGFWERVTHLEGTGVGTRFYPSRPWRLSESGGAIQSPAPTLGQDNLAVLSHLLGHPLADLSSLEEAQVIGTRPPRDTARPVALPVDESVAEGRWQEHDPRFMEVLGLADSPADQS